MNLVIDIGNTLVKVYLFENDEIISKKTLDEVSLIVYVKSIAKDYDIKNIICSTVTKSYRTELTEINEDINYYELSDQDLKIPIHKKKHINRKSN